MKLLLLTLTLLFTPHPAHAAYDFTDKSAGFTLQLPDDWEPLSDPQTTDLISILSPTPGSHSIAGFVPPHSIENLPALIIQEEPYPDGTSHSTFTKSQIQNYAKQMTQLEPTQMYWATSPAVPALVPSMSLAATCFETPPGFVVDTRSRDKFRVHTVVFLGKDHMVLLHFLADNTMYPDFRPHADTIATSFSFHYFSQPSLKSRLSSLSFFDYAIVVTLFAALIAAVAGIFYVVYHRTKWDNI